MTEHSGFERLSGVDSAWWRMERPNNPLTITALISFASELDVEFLKHFVAERLLAFPRFHQRIDSSGWAPCWRSGPISLQHHVQEITLPDPSRETLARWVGEECSLSMDPSRPLWSVHLVHGGPEPSSLLIKIHHSVADGFALVALLLSLIDEGQRVVLPGGFRQPPRIEPWKQGARASRFARSISQLRQAVRLTPLFAKMALATPYTLAEFLTLSRDTSFAPPTDGLSGVKRVAWSASVPVAAMKRAAKELGGTINDLLLLALTGALRRLAADSGNATPNVPNVRVAIPVNLVDLQHRTARLGNGFGLVLFELPVSQPTVESRYRAIKAGMDRLKRSPQAPVTFGVFHALGRMPEVAQDAALGLFHRRAAAVVTNVPGPQNLVSLCGTPIKSCMFWVPQSLGIGLGISFFSYAGGLRLGVVADSAVLDDPQALVDGFSSEMTELLPPE
jgi:diacylglycerol O-acyltransferase